MVEDVSDTTIWRDYAIQHLAFALPHAAQPERGLDALLALTKASDQYAGTALLQLERLAATPRLAVPAEILRLRVSQLAADPQTQILSASPPWA